jgi:hypothetical protein
VQFDLPFYVVVLFYGVPWFLSSLWAGWLGRQPATPRFVRRMRMLIAVLCAACFVASGFAARAPFGRVDFDATTSQQVLSDSIVASMRWVAAGLGVIVLWLLVLLFGSWRWHWSLRAPKVPGSPPYR